MAFLARFLRPDRVPAGSASLPLRPSQNAGLAEPLEGCFPFLKGPWHLWLHRCVGSESTVTLLCEFWL